MGQNCTTMACGPDSHGFDISTVLIDTSRLDLADINILDFELRVKRFAHPVNNGKVSIRQLMEAFKDTAIYG